MFDSFFPVLLSLLSAFLFALGAQFQSLGLVHMDSRSGAAITISTSAMLYLLVSPFFLNLEYLLEPAILIFVLVGLFRPAVSANLALAGLKFLGPTLSSTLTSTALGSKGWGTFSGANIKRLRMRAGACLGSGA